VNNAIYQGPGTMQRFDELSESELRALFEGNVFAQLALISRLLPSMLARGSGIVVNMVSATAHLAPPAPPREGGWGLAYAMTKAALSRVAPSLAVEHAGSGVLFYSVDPGFVVTERMEATAHTGHYSSRFRGASPEVIGRAVRWLATDPKAVALNGQVINAQAEAKRLDREASPRQPD
jgi:NAD(P)-dependent dehydrogenase (short-subunit alcohol dehydrogenase family)